MKLYIKSAEMPYAKMPVNTMVNKVGKYLKKNIGGAFNLTTSSNTCDVWFLLLYQVPRPYQIPGKAKEGYNSVKEMTIDLNITTYQNKLRVNIIEVTPNARTLGYDLYDPAKITTLEDLKKKILQKVIKKVSKAYAEYDYIFMDDICYNQEAYERYRQQQNRMQNR